MPTELLDPEDCRIPADLAANLVDPTAYANERIFETYHWLRANNPLGYAEVEGFDPFWVVTKHEDILRVSRDNALFHSGVRATTLSNKATIARVTEIAGSPHLVRSLVQMDAPDHMKYRLLTQAWFTPANLKKRTDDIQAIADKTVAHMASKGGACDFVADVALNYPLEVVMNILGVPEADFPLMLKLTQEIFGPQDPDTARFMDALSTEQFAEIIAGVVAEFSAYFEGISADRRVNPRDDLASLIAHATIDGAPIGEREAAGYYIIVASAGHDTTSSSTAAAMWALATHPDLLRRLKGDLSLVPAFVEEAIRWATPVKTFMRSPTADTELRGRRLRKGDWMMLCYASGNRDEDVFDNPYTFDIDRAPNRQLAFGNGAHVCLGQHLARQEMRILFETLLPRLQSVTLDGEPAVIESTFVNGLKRLPIRFQMA